MENKTINSKPKVSKRTTSKKNTDDAVKKIKNTAKIAEAK